MGACPANRLDYAVASGLNVIGLCAMGDIISSGAALSLGIEGDSAPDSSIHYGYIQGLAQVSCNPHVSERVCCQPGKTWIFIRLSRSRLNSIAEFVVVGNSFPTRRRGQNRALSRKLVT